MTPKGADNKPSSFVENLVEFCSGRRVACRVRFIAADTAASTVGRMIKDRPHRLDLIYRNQTLYFVTFAARSPVVAGVSPAEYKATDTVATTETAHASSSSVELSHLINAPRCRHGVASPCCHEVTTPGAPRRSEAGTLFINGAAA